MIKNLFYVSLLMVVALFGACKNNVNSEANSNQITEVGENESSDLNSASQIVDTWCFAAKTKAMNSKKKTGHNYQFLKVSLDASNKVQGWIQSAPYGIDGMKGHVTGTYNSETGELNLNETALGEGEIYEQSREFRIIENSLQLDYGTAENKRASLNRYDCEEFDAMYASFQKEMIAKRVNSSDRSRVMKIKNLQELGYTNEELNAIPFMELEVDLDNNYETQEYLIYVMDSMLCGSGGCSLYITDKEGKTLSYMTVTKLPIYTTNSTIEDQQKRWI